jgi:hypothetical protein
MRDEQSLVLISTQSQCLYERMFITNWMCRRIVGAWTKWKVLPEEHTWHTSC